MAVHASRFPVHGCARARHIYDRIAWAQLPSPRREYTPART
jgi:hypothetical protein